MSLFSIYYNFIQNPTSSNVRLFKNSGRDGYGTSYATNPFWSIEHVRSNNYSDYFSGILSLKYDFNKNINITYTGNLALTSINSDRHNDGDVLTRKYVTPDVPFLNGKTGAYAGLSNVDSNYYQSLSKRRKRYIRRWFYRER